MHRLPSTLLVLSLPAWLVAWHATASAQEPTNLETAEAEIRSLQEERIDLLQRAVELALAQYREGVLGFKSVHETKRDLFDAQLEIAETREERIRLLTSQLNIAEAALAMAEARFQAALTTALDVHQARSAMLRIKIQLLKLRQVDATKQP